jgi:hypoxanthine phosphoribosyltransferase
MHSDIESVLISSDRIAEMVSQIAERINSDYAGKNPMLISVLKGSFIFMADLLRKITIPCTVDFMAVSSYGKKSVTTGAVKIVKDLEKDIEGRHVIIVEDILDSGITLSYIMNLMNAKKPASIRLCTLLDKPARRVAPVKVDYEGFEIPDEFVVGYGLDYAEQYRNLPYIGILSPRVYAHE